MFSVQMPGVLFLHTALTCIAPLPGPPCSTTAGFSMCGKTCIDPAVQCCSSEYLVGAVCTNLWCKMAARAQKVPAGLVCLRVRAGSLVRALG